MKKTFLISLALLSLLIFHNAQADCQSAQTNLGETAKIYEIQYQNTVSTIDALIAKIDPVKTQLESANSNSDLLDRFSKWKDNIVNLKANRDAHVSAIKDLQNNFCSLSNDDVNNKIIGISKKGETVRNDENFIISEFYSMLPSLNAAIK